MGTPGMRVVLPSGKVGVLASGKAAVFDADGKCAACCIEYGEDCACCLEGKTPKHFTITFAGILACVESPPAWFVAALAAINDTHLLTQDAGDSCKWAKAFTTVLGGDCGYGIILSCSADVWRIYVYVGNLDAYSNDQAVFEATGVSMVCLDGLVGQANDYDVGDCAGTIPECGIFATGIAGYDGDADIEAGDQT